MRLTKDIESVDLIRAEQAGFRNNFSTIDHICTLHCLVNLYLSKKKKLFCTYIDYKQAFDKIDRVTLWEHLLSNNVNGKIFNVIYNLYKCAKSYLKGIDIQNPLEDNKNNCRDNDHHNSHFDCDIGVRQGDNLSPLLFSTFLCDFENHLSMYYSGF